MENLNTLLDFIKLSVLTTLNQLLALLGVFFLFGLVLYLLARFTRNTFMRSIGVKADVVFTGWLGTPVHELGHAIFCVIFRHRIVDMKLYDPNPDDGSLGYVNHAFDPGSIYQRIGNFFISAGPILFGSVVLYAAMYYLLPNKNIILNIINIKSSAFTSFAGLQIQFEIFYTAGYKTLQALFSGSNPQTWTFWLFLYISLCVSSHMELSPSDLKGLWSGLAAIITALFIVNTAALLFGYNITKYVMTANGYLGLFSGLFIFAAIISALFFISSFIILSVYSLMKYRRFVNPFG